MDSVLVFTRTKHGADRVVRQLEHAGISATAMHADKSQAQRTRALERFQGTARSACSWPPTSRSAGSTSTASRT